MHEATEAITVFLPIQHPAKEGLKQIQGRVMPAMFSGFQFSIQLKKD